MIFFRIGKVFVYRKGIELFLERGSYARIELSDFLNNVFTKQKKAAQTGK